MPFIGSAMWDIDTEDVEEEMAITTSGPDIVCWGDSMTAGFGGGGTTYPGVLQNLLAADSKPGTVRNSGVSGESSVDITARTGATPYIVDVSGGVIPASGGVTITFRQVNGFAAEPLVGGFGPGIPGGGPFSGTLNGVHGTISLAGSIYTFNRTGDGLATPTDRPSPFRTDYSEARRGDIAIIWIGENGPTAVRARNDARAIIEHLSPVIKRWLVISRPRSIDSDDALSHDQFGRRFIAIRKYMVEFGLADAGITPTAQDTTDIGNGVIPTSLRSDEVHFTAAGYTITAQQIYKRLLELGWV